MNTEAFSLEQNLTIDDVPKLAISGSNERICNDAKPNLDPDSIRRFCQVWGEVGRVILGRRNIVTA